MIELKFSEHCGQCGMDKQNKVHQKEECLHTRSVVDWTSAQATASKCIRYNHHVFVPVLLNWKEVFEGLKNLPFELRMTGFKGENRLCYDCGEEWRDHFDENKKPICCFEYVITKKVLEKEFGEVLKR